MSGGGDTSSDAETVSSAEAVDAEGFLVPQASLPQEWGKLADYLTAQGFTFSPEPAP